MTPTEIIELYREAELQGIVTDIENYAECEDHLVDCDDCPAQRACNYLSEGGKFTTFKANFDKLIREEL